MIKIPNCPKCGSDTEPKLIEINILEEGARNTYEELYKCDCGCRFVALVPRDNAIDNAMVYQIVKDGNAERWV